MNGHGWKEDAEVLLYDQKAKFYPKAKCDLKGQRILVTGRLAGFTRVGIKNWIATNNGYAMDQMTREVDIVVAGEKAGPNKIVQAREWGIKVVTAEAFMYWAAQGHWPSNADFDENKSPLFERPDGLPTAKQAKDNTSALLAELAKLEAINFEEE